MVAEGSTVAFWPVEPHYQGGHPLNLVNPEVSCKEVRIGPRVSYHGEESDYPDRLLDNLRNVENRLIIIYTCTYIWGIKAEDRIGHRFCMCAFNEIEIFIQSYRFSDRCSDRLNETIFARFKRINRVRGKRKEKKKVGKNSVQLLSSRHECNSRISDRKI